MPEGSYLYCDVSLPVPLDQPFTYALPETLRHRVKPGCRVLVPFGSRRLTGVALACHDAPPDVPAREVMRLIDADRGTVRIGDIARPPGGLRQIGALVGCQTDATGVP